MAGLCNGTALHVDSFCGREIVQYALHLVLVVYEPFSTYDKSGVYRNVCVEVQCFLYQLFRSFKLSRHSNNLSKLTLFSTVSVMVAVFRADHNVRYVHLRVYTAGNASGYDKVRAEAVYHLYRSNSRVYLSHTAFLYHDFFFSDVTCNEVFVVIAFHGSIRE